MTDRVAEIEHKLRAALQPLKLEIEDESHKHAGHAGARESGGGHFNVTIVSAAFTGQGLLQRHRLVYDALGDTMRREIHALSIRALSPEEA
ncbi:MAG TPA: BolA family transcriptional regulator [Gammaproteobacteria bacterium]|nr:BolA family transcriptional regulator [Gammaproteobacteria bacterium]